MPTNQTGQPVFESHETLLSRFHEGTLTEDEAGRLLEFWDEKEMPAREAGAIHLVDRVLRQMAAEKITLSPQRLDAFKSAARRRFGMREPDPALPPFAFDFFPAEAREKPRADRDEPTIRTSLAPESVAQRKPHQASRRTNNAVSHAMRSFILILALALILIPSTIYFEFYGSPARQGREEGSAFASIAFVSGITETQFTEDSWPVKLGRRFEQEEKFTLRSGKVEFQFKNNVRMTFEGPGSLKLISPMSIFCDRGRLSVTVPPEGKGFEVASPHLTVRDLGTKFVLDVMEKTAEVHVIKGEVEANWLTKDWISLKQGGGVRTDSGNMSRIAADRDLFVPLEIMQRETRSFLDRQEKTHDARTLRWKNDPRTLLFCDFESGGQTGSQPSPTVRGCRPVKGEWDHSRALAFKKHGDAVRTSVAHRPQTFTLLTTLKIDRLNRYTNMIFVWRGKDRGKILWKLDRSGRMQLVVDEGGSKLPVSYDSPVVVGPQLYGVWLRLATTVDVQTKTVRHYLDGRPVSEHPLENTPGFALEEMEIGNWTQKGGPAAGFLNGSMEEFLLYDGLLNENEF